MDAPPLGELIAGDPTSVGPYALLGRLGAGGMGQVYLGENAAGERVAVKVMKDPIRDGPRFHQEIDAMSRVPPFCTAPLLDHGEVGGRPYLVMGYVAGPTLTAAAPLDPERVRALALSTASALAVIHAANLIHRDIKPDNVVMSQLGPVLIDFGIARVMDLTTRLSRTGDQLGTPGWLSPEQIRVHDATSASDVFVWGCLVAYAASGRHPYSDGDDYAIEGNILRGSPDLSALEASLAALVRRALTSDPGSRPQARDLVADLLIEAPKVRQRPRPRRRWPLAVVVVAAGLGAVLLLGRTDLPEAAASWSFDSADTHSLTVPTGSLTGGKLSPREQGASTGGPVLRTDRDYTVAVRARLTSDAGNATALSQDGNSTSGFFLGYLSEQRKWAFSVHDRDDGEPVALRAFSAQGPQVGRWTHLAGVYDAGKNQISLYIDGELQEMRAAYPLWQASGPMRIGAARWHGSPVDLWPGDLDDVQVFASALSPDQIRALAT